MIRDDKQYLSGLYIVVPILPYVYFTVTGAPLQPVIILLLGIFILFLLRRILLNQSYFLQSDKCVPFSFGTTLGFLFFFHILLHFFFSHSIWIREHSILIILIALVLIQFTFIFFKGLINEDLKKFMLLTAAGIPFLVFISIEIQVFSLEKGLLVFGYKKLFLLLQFLWLGCAWLIVKKKRLAYFDIVRKIFLPSLIFGYTLLVFYQPIIRPINDLFELANPANTLLRVFQFREIPMLDFMSSHMFSEQWYGLLYQSIYGVSNRLDFTIYGFFNNYIFLITVYWVLIKVGFGLRSTSIFIFFFPILDYVFFAPVTYVYLVFFMVMHLFKKPISKRVFSLFLLLFALIIWRIDTGVSAIFSAIIFTPLYFSLSRSSMSLRDLLIGLGLFICFLIGLVLIAVLIRPWDRITQGFLSAFHYIKGSQAHGYAYIFDGSYHQFYVYHFLFALLAVVLIVYAFYAIRRDTLNKLTEDNKWLLFSIFSFIVFLANAQRGLVRHGFAENNELFFSSSFYLGLASFCVNYIKDKKEPFQFASFFYVLFFTFILTKYFPFLPKELNANSLIRPASFLDLNSHLTPANYRGRVIDSDVFERKHFAETKTYLRDNLASHETFIDFSNTPMLYYYCQRRIPGYFNQNLQNTIDVFLQEQLLNSIKKEDVPIVIFSDYPPSWLDATDGILNTIRYDRIADFIFENYKPIGIIDYRSVFGLKNRKWQYISRKDTLLISPLSIDLGYLAGWEGNNYISNAWKKSNCIVQEMNLKVLDSSFVQTLAIRDSLLGTSGMSLLLKVHLDSKKYMKETESNVIFRDSTGKEVHHVRFKRDDEQFTSYAFRLSNHYFWHQYKSLTMEISAGEGIEKVCIIKNK